MDKSNFDHRHGDPQGTHKIDMLCLGIIYISLFSCLIRSDYNFLFIFFVYFLWQQSYSPMGAQISLVVVALTIIFDILFAIVEIPAWTSNDAGNPVWQTLKPMHSFAIFCFVVILIMKLALGFFLFKKHKAQSQN